MQFNLIGPGRVGLALAQALIDTNQYSLLGIYHPTYARAEKAAKILAQGMACHSLNQLPQADVTFIATQDTHIKIIASELAATKNLKPESLVAHLSGILSADILMPLKTQDIHIGSLHPLKAFCHKETPEKNAFKHIDCAVEGDTFAVTQLSAIANALNANVFEINPEQKASYHAAAIMASNYLVTLAAEANALFESSGIPEKKAHALCTRLMQTSLDNLKQADIAKDALTGPLMRGDIESIQKHLNTIDSPITKALYQTAGLATLPLTNLNQPTRNIFKALFTSKKVT
ncbi:MAG: DUF2520 domain-containing protein [Legionella sp.]|nr:DUF2520 domain-containing protein [Legionella sp.]